MFSHNPRPPLLFLVGIWNSHLRGILTISIPVRELDRYWLWAQMKYSMYAY